MKKWTVGVITAFSWLLINGPAMAACLSIIYGNTFNSWQNHCNREVYVSWTDDRSCSNWSCASSIRPYTKSTATISNGQVRWCEWYDGDSGRGPC